MNIGLIPNGEPGVFRSLLLPEIADAMVNDERIIGLAVTIDNTAVGAIAGIPEEHRLHILSFYVAPEYRRRQVGTLLMNTMIDISKNLMLGIEIAYTVTEEEHKTLQPFLEHLNFREEAHEKAIYITTVQQAVQILPQNNSKKIGLSFSQLDDYILSKATKMAMRNFDQIPEGGLESKHVARDVSVAIIKDNEISAYIAVEQSRSGELIISAIKADQCSPSEFIRLLHSDLFLLKHKYPPETKLICQAVKTEGFALLKRLLSDCLEQVSYTYYRAL